MMSIGVVPWALKVEIEGEEWTRRKEKEERELTARPTQPKTTTAWILSKSHATLVEAIEESVFTRSIREKERICWWRRWTFVV